MTQGTAPGRGRPRAPWRQCFASSLPCGAQNGDSSPLPGGGLSPCSCTPAVGRRPDGKGPMAGQGQAVQHPHPTPALGLQHCLEPARSRVCSSTSQRRELLTGPEREEHVSGAPDEPGMPRPHPPSLCSTTEQEGKRRRQKQGRSQAVIHGGASARWAGPAAAGSGPRLGLVSPPGRRLAPDR